MEKAEELKIIEDMQKVVEQMKLDDIEEDPTSEEELFECSACGKSKPRAGSVMYADNCVFCNDCVLYAEIGLALKKFDSVETLLDSMEDIRLEELCRYIKEEEARASN